MSNGPKDISTLREHLFATLEALRDHDNPMPIDRARAIADVAQTLINTAKVEVEYVRVAGGVGESAFIEGRRSEAAPAGIRSTTVHRLR